MRVVVGLLSYLIAAVALVGGAAALLFAAAAPAVTMVTAPQDAPKVGPRLQAWLDREAEGRLYAEMQKAAEAAERERVEARRIKASSTPDYAAFARARDEEKHATERGARKKDKSKREARKQSRQLREAERSGSPRVAQEQSLHYYPDLHGRSQ
jgi:hypothetical protein